MKREASEYRVGVGASSLLLILVVLALTAMSLLALHNAQATLRLTERSRDMNVAYYQAAAEAQRRIALVDELRLEKGADDLRAALDQAGLEDVELEGTIFRFTLDAANGRQLAVEGTLGGELTRHELIGVPFEEGTQTLLLTEGS